MQYNVIGSIFAWGKICLSLLPFYHYIAKRGNYIDFSLNSIKIEDFSPFF